MVRKEEGFILCAITAICLLSSIALAGDAGHIQVKCEAGITVLLDGEKKGITSKELGGLIIQDVPSGEYTLKFLKEGLEPAEIRITANAGEVTVCRAPSLRRKSGMLLVRSLPVECEITCHELGLEGIKKRENRWRKEGIPVGTYEFTFKALEKELHKQVEIRYNLEARVMVNFLRDEIGVEYPSPRDTCMLLRDIVKNAPDDWEGLITAISPHMSNQSLEVLNCLVALRQYAAKKARSEEDLITVDVFLVMFLREGCPTFVQVLNTDDLSAAALTNASVETHQDVAILALGEQTLRFRPESGTWKVDILPDDPASLGKLDAFMKEVKSEIGAAGNQRGAVRPLLPSRYKIISMLKEKLDAEDVELKYEERLVFRDAGGKQVLSHGHVLRLDLNRKTHYRRYWGIYIKVQLEGLDKSSIRSSGSKVILTCRNGTKRISEFHWVGNGFDDPQARGYTDTAELSSIAIATKSEETAMQVAEAFRQLVEVVCGE